MHLGDRDGWDMHGRWLEGNGFGRDHGDDVFNNWYRFGDGVADGVRRNVVLCLGHGDRLSVVHRRHRNGILRQGNGHSFRNGRDRLIMGKGDSFGVRHRDGRYRRGKVRLALLTEESAFFVVEMTKGTF
jgi:hypothetical protein